MAFSLKNLLLVFMYILYIHSLSGYNNVINVLSSLMQKIPSPSDSTQGLFIVVSHKSTQQKSANISLVYLSVVIHKHIDFGRCIFYSHHVKLLKCTPMLPRQRQSKHSQFTTQLQWDMLLLASNFR